MLIAMASPAPMLKRVPRTRANSQPAPRYRARISGLDSKLNASVSKLAQLRHDSRLDLDRFCLSPARKRNLSAGRPVKRGLAEAS